MRDMLLPLPVQKARALSLEYHLALSVLAARRGGQDEAIRLMQAVYHARFMQGSGSGDAALLGMAETALDDMVARVDAGGAWVVSDAEQVAIANAIAIHDRLTNTVPYHRFAAAWERMQYFGRQLQEAQEAAA
ncbi:hypothetical protein AB3X91_39210 [Paraburkholderia sp. BR14263]|uniref:hypothetical protein n=1 Tax=unclassified Paraburkholderia TaxID=2615204 RepID=UPI0034CE198F